MFNFFNIHFNPTVSINSSHFKNGKFEKFLVSNERFIGISINGFIENVKTFPNSIFVIPINDSFKLTEFKDNSVHGAFMNFLQVIQNNDIDVMQNKLYQSLGITENYKGRVGETYFNYNNAENEVWFLGNSVKKENSENTWFCEYNLTPYDFWKYICENKMKTNKECMLVPLIGAGNAGVLTCKESVISIIDSYFHFYEKQPTKSIIISARKEDFEKSKINFSSIKKYIDLKKKIILK